MKVGSRVSDRGRAIAGATATLAILAITSCGAGARPVLIEQDTLDSAAAERASLLDTAPAGTPSLSVPVDLVFQASSEDAITHWASEADVTYRGDCANPVDPAGSGTTAGDESVLCHTSTGRPSEFLLGPTSEETWYVVSLFESGEGVKVVAVVTAGG